jgi:hypothetical protein
VSYDYIHDEVDYYEAMAETRKRRAWLMLLGYVLLLGGFALWVLVMEFVYRSTAGG